MLSQFHGGAYKYNPVPKFMFLCQFAMSSNPTLPLSSFVNPAEFGNGGLNNWGNIDPVKLSSIVSKVSLPRFGVNMETLDKVGPYGIRIPAGFTLEPMAVEFNIDNKFITERFYNFILSRMVSINEGNLTDVIGTRYPRSNYEMEISIGIYSNNSMLPIVEYVHHKCVMCDADGMEVDYTSIDNIDPNKINFYPNDGMSIIYDDSKFSSIVNLIGSIINPATLVYFGQVALDIATNFALRTVSFANAQQTAGANQGIKAVAAGIGQ